MGGGGGKKKKERGKIDPKAIVNNFKNSVYKAKQKLKYRILTPQRKYKEWYYKKYLEPRT